MNRRLFLFFFLFSFGISFAQPVSVQWDKYLSQYDFVWEQLPLQWNEGAFVGNGQVGMMFYCDTISNSIIIQLGRHDVTDHRKAPDKKTSLGVKGANVHYDYPRLDIGKMTCKMPGKILSGTMRLSLWNATLTGDIETDNGRISLTAYTLYDYDVNVIQMKHSTGKSNNGYSWNFIPGNPQSGRSILVKKKEYDYDPNPQPTLYLGKNGGECVQPLLAGGDYATVWREVKANTNTSTLYISIANEVPKSGESIKKATNDIALVQKMKTEKAAKAMRESWHKFYAKSFVSVPDKRMEAFYWSQIYKLGASVREDGPALDLLGPFYKRSIWLGLWWNLNVQLTYWPLYPTNHLDICKGYEKLMKDHFVDILNSFEDKPFPAQNIGDYTWALNNLYLQYSYAGDKKAINTVWLDMARKVYDLYKKHFVEIAGVINLKNMESPEYEGFKVYDNPNYNLMLLRWLLNTMTESEIEFGHKTKEMAEWQDVIKRLHPYPVDERGFMLAENVPFLLSHRHYSHLIGLYPLFQINPDDEESRRLIDKSVTHWHTVQGGKGLAGYSFTLAASMYAALGRGNEAYNSLKDFIYNRKPSMSRFLDNTMYVEAGNRCPCIETPMNALSAFVELLMQSWGGKIRPFSAMPTEWKDADFLDLRAQGGFLVSGIYRNGKTQWLSVTSEAGAPCVIKVPEWNSVYIVKGNKSTQIKTLSNGEFEIALKKGETIQLAGVPSYKSRVISIKNDNTNDLNPFGLKQGKGIKTIQAYPENEPYTWKTINRLSSCSEGAFNDGYIQYEPIQLTSSEKKIVKKAIESQHVKYDPKGKMLTNEVKAWNYHTDALSGTMHHVRSSFNYAVALLDLGDKKDEQKALDILRKTISLQVKDTTKIFYGVWPYYEEEPLETKKSPIDYNWADFNVVSLLDVYMGHQQKLPADLKQDIEKALILGAKSIRRRNCSPGYTNIAIMGTYCTYLVSHLFDLPDLKKYADFRLKSFYDYTLKKGGFSEYNSPTYTIVAIDELQRMRNHIIEPQSRLMIDSLYNIAWETIARHYHKPSSQWAGPHSRSYSTLVNKDFYGILKQASNGKIDLGVEPLRADVKLRHQIPSYLMDYFLHPTYPRTETDLFEKEEPKIIGTTYLTDKYAFGTSSGSSLWNQRRPLTVYWGTQTKPLFLQLRLLRDNYDFSAAYFYSMQKENFLLAGINFATNGGNKHISLDKLKDGKFVAKDLRLRFEFANCKKSDIVLPTAANNSALFTIEGLTFDIDMFVAKFDNYKLTWEKGDDGQKAWLDLVIYTGNEKDFDLTAINEAIFGMSLTVGEACSEKPIYNFNDGKMDASWKGMEISVPMKPQKRPRLFM